MELPKHPDPYQDRLFAHGTAWATHAGQTLGEAARALLTAPRTDAGDVPLTELAAAARTLAETEEQCRQSRHEIIAAMSGLASRDDVAAAAGCSTRTVRAQKGRVSHITGATPADFELRTDGRWYLKQ